MRTPLIPLALLVAFVVGCSGNTPTGTTKTTASKAPAANKTATPAPAVASATLSGTVLAPSGLIAQGGGNLVAQGGGNLVAQGGGNYNLLADADATTTAAAGASTELSGATVIALDAAGTEVERTQSNAKGEFSFTKLEAEKSYELVVPCKSDAGEARLATVSKPGKGKTISAATTCAAATLFSTASDFMAKFDADSFQGLVAACDAEIKVRPLEKVLAALGNPKEMGNWGKKLAEENAKIKEALTNAAAKLKVAAAKLSCLGKPLLEMQKCVEDAGSVD
jgi:hypothetical protein